MTTSSQIIDRISTLSSPKAILLVPSLYDLILDEKYAWSAYSDQTHLTSYTHTLRAYNSRAISTAELRLQTLQHLNQTLPARLAILTVKGHHSEGGNGNGAKVARMNRSLQAMREVSQVGGPMVFQIVEEIVGHEAAYTMLEVQHADAVESVRVMMMTDFAQGRIVETGDVVVFAKRMLSIGICLEGLFESRGAHGTHEGLGGLGGVGILPWW
jgi:hypothetical protein